MMTWAVPCRPVSNRTQATRRVRTRERPTNREITHFLPTLIQAHAPVLFPVPYRPVALKQRHTILPQYRFRDTHKHDRFPSKDK